MLLDVHVVTEVVESRGAGDLLSELVLLVEERGQR